MKQNRITSADTAANSEPQSKLTTSSQHSSKPHVGRSALKSIALSVKQQQIIEKILFGATIFVDRTNIENFTYILTDEFGNDETVNKNSFLKLEKYGLIKHKQSPHVDIEMWS